MGFVRFQGLWCGVQVRGAWVGRCCRGEERVGGVGVEGGRMAVQAREWREKWVVSRSLGILHWMGLTCGVVFLVTSVIDSQVVNGVPTLLSARNLLICAMILLTLISMFAISTRMLDLRNQMVFIDNVPHDDARRVEFNRLHVWSTRLESTVLLLGLAVILLTSRRLS